MLCFYLVYFVSLQMFIFCSSNLVVSCRITVSSFFLIVITLHFDTVLVYFSCMNHSKSFSVFSMLSPLTLNGPTDLISLLIVNELKRYSHMAKLHPLVNRLLSTVHNHTLHVHLQMDNP